VYGWIATGEIGEADGLFVVEGRFLIHWPTFRAKQFKPREKIRGQIADLSEEAEMAWLETDRHGRLRIGFKYYDGLKCWEPLGVSANKQTIAEARRLCATIQLELKARTFDYAKRFPDSDRIKQRGIETPEKIQQISVTLSSPTVGGRIDEKQTRGERAAEHATKEHGVGCPESNPGVRSRQEAAQRRPPARNEAI
jgi:Arm DNA-binding domain